MPRRTRTSRRLAASHKPVAAPANERRRLSDRARRWVCRLLIIAAVAAAYANAAPAALVFDDFGFVDRDGSKTLWPPEWMSWSRPMLRLTLALNYQLAQKDGEGRSDPRGYHVFNIAVHMATALVVFALLRRALRLPRAGPWPDQQADGLALATAIIWSVHPLTTQAVTYVVQRGESLAALGIVLYLYCLLRTAQAGAPAARGLWSVASLSACLLGLASKETGAAAIPIGILFDRALLASSWRELVARRGWIHATLLALGVFGVMKLMPEMLRSGGYKTAGYNIGTHTWWEYARSQPAAILHYLRLALWPNRLCLDYFWPASSNEQALVPGMVVVAALLLSVWLLWKRPAWGMLAIAFWLLLAPSSGAVAIQDVVVEHRFYAPLVLVVLALVVATWQGIRRLAARGRWPEPSPAMAAAVVGCIVVTALALRTHRRNDDYRSEMALWEADLQVAPENPRMHANLALLYWKQNRLEPARRHYREALRTSKGGIGEAAYAYEANWFAALICRDLGRHEEAIAHFRAALAAAVADEEKMAVGLELATGLDALGRAGEAGQVFAQLLALDREHAKLHWTYAEFLQRRGQAAAALEHWREAAALAPDDAQLLQRVRSLSGT